MSLKTEMLADIAVMESDIASGDTAPTFTWTQDTTSGSYTCVPSSKKNNKVLGEGGFLVDADLVMSVRLDQFEGISLPQPQHTITYLGERFRIINVHIEPVAGSYMRLFCEGPFRGV